MTDLKEAMDIEKKFLIDVNGEQDNFLLEEISLHLIKKLGSYL